MSGILEQWVEGKGLKDTLVIDGHIHIGAWPYTVTFYNVEEAVTESIRYMESNGVDAFCALAGGYNFGIQDYRLGNDFLLAVWDKLRDCMVPFLCVNPCDAKENIIEELKRMYDAGMRCIKLINGYQRNYPGDGPNLMAVYEFAAAHQMLVLNHVWEESAIVKIAEMYPETDFIFAHYYGDYQDDVMARFPNVYANMWWVGEMGWLDQGIRKLGPEKFMMGSDGFANPMSVGIGPVVFADIDDDAKRLILGGNAARLLDKYGVLPEKVKKVWVKGEGA